ncbi:MAG: zinc transporter ZntB [Proteobacteria bacterium]|nr:zinc transporter ZntB [Pseudomonadota bacterium]MDA0846393.1 zinc transporter ZntB [Pseudomonadota bacterium]
MSHAPPSTSNASLSSAPSVGDAMHETPIIFAFEIMGDGAGRDIFGPEVSRLLADDRLAWAHLDANHADTAAWLASEISYLDDIVIEALLAEETRPRFVPVNDGVLLILRGVNLNANADPEDMVSIRMFVDSRRVVSLQKRSLRAVADIQSKLTKGSGPKNSSDLITQLMGLLFARMAPVAADLSDVMDTIEEYILDGADSLDREQVLGIRKKAIALKRYIHPQRDLVIQMMESKPALIDEIGYRRLIEAHDSISRVIDELDAVRERAHIINDEVTNQLTERLNKNMYALSVIAAIFLPLGFLTGLLGINLAGIPGAENPAAFAIFCAMLVTLVIAQILLFRKLKWF